MVDFSAHAVVLSAAGSATAAGQVLTGPVDSLDKLVRLLEWYCGRGGLAPLGGPGQVWVVGQGACAPLGLWTTDDTQLDEKVLGGAADELGAAGWALIGPPSGQMLVAKTLSIGGRRQRRLVQIILEPFAPLITGRSDIGLCEDLPGDDEDAAAELGRRIRWCVEHLGVLPMLAASTTGARIQDLEYRHRRDAGRGAVVDAPGRIEGLDDLVGGGDGGAGVVGVGEIEPAAHWGREHIDPAEIGAGTEMVLLDQSAAYLATAGSIELGYGPVRRLSGAALAEVLAADKLPFGVFVATLPATERLSVPPAMPAPHPLMRPDRDVIAPITTESVRGLCAPLADGGAGLSIEDLAIDEAWVGEGSRRFLEHWATTLRAARRAAIAAEDTALATYVGAIYKHYVGRMGTDKWAPSKMHHCQPVWRAAIIAHCRWRARRQAMTIHRDTGLWPIHTFTDSWRYLAPPDMSLAPTLADTREREKTGETIPLGRLVEEDRHPLTDTQRQALLAATCAAEIAAVIYPSGAPAVPMHTSTPAPAQLAAPLAPPPPAPPPPAPPPGEAGDRVDDPPPPAAVPSPLPAQPDPRRRRAGKGRRERSYLGDHLEDILAPVSARAIADLSALVAEGTFSYLPDAHTSHTSTLPATHTAPAAAAVPSGPGREVPDTLRPHRGLAAAQRRVTPYAVAAITAVLLIAVIIIALIVI